MIHPLHIVWNPAEGIDLGFFVIRYYSLMFVVAFTLGWFIMKKIFEREDVSLEKLDSLFVYLVVATMIGARLGHVLFYDWGYFKHHLLEIFLPIREIPGTKLFGFIDGWTFTGFAGLASHGAAIAVILTMYYYSKKVLHKPFLWILDRIVIPVSSGGIFVRFGNFFNSEIVGKPTDSFLGIQFVQDTFSKTAAVTSTHIADSKAAYHAIATDPKFADLLSMVPAKHPAQLYEAFGYFIVFVILFYMYWKTNARNQTGYLFGVFLILLWSVRFIVEFIKESQGGFEGENPILSTGQWLSIPFILIGFYFVFRNKVVTKQRS